MVLDGRVAALWGAGIGWPGFKTLAASPGGARFIAPDAAEIARIRAKHSFLKPLTVPAGSAALSIERVSYLANGQPVEFTRSFYRGDIYDFVAELNLGQD